GPSSLATSPRERGAIMRCLFSGRIRLLVLLAVTLAGATALQAGARPPGTNGQIAFGRFNPALGDTQVYVVNPDGSGQRLVQGPTDIGEGPQWFPDGAHIATGGSSRPGGGARRIDPDDGRFREIDGQYRGLCNPGGRPSRDGTLVRFAAASDYG